MSDTEKVFASYAQYLKSLKRLTAINKTAVMTALKAAAITTVMVRFDGEGDSGQIEEINAFQGGRGQPLPEAEVEIKRLNFPSSKRNAQRLPLRDAIEHLCYDLLATEHDGWENNDGAFGEFTFDVKQRRIALEFNGRFCDYTTSEHAW